MCAKNQTHCGPKLVLVNLTLFPRQSQTLGKEDLRSPGKKPTIFLKKEMNSAEYKCGNCKIGGEAGAFWLYE